MQVLKLIQQYDCNIPHKIGYQIDLGGSDGEIFSLLDQPNKVIKLCVIYDTPVREIKDYQKTQQVLDYVMTIQPPAYVRVYEHGYLGTYSRKMVDWHQDQRNFLLYYYIMEKLSKISEDEKKVFHSILSHEDWGKEKNYSPEQIEKMLQGMSRGLDFEASKVTLFLRHLKEAGLSHLDLHPRNIMVDGCANYRMVDLDRISIKEI